MTDRGNRFVILRRFGMVMRLGATFSLLGMATFVAFVAGGGSSSAAAAESDAGGLTLESLPPSVMLRPGEMSEVTVLVANSTAANLTVQEVALQAGPSVKANASPALPVTLAAGGSFPLIVAIEAGDDLRPTSIVVLVKGLARLGATSKTLTTIRSGTTVEVQAIAPEAMLKVAFESMPQSISDGESSRSAILVTNDSDQALEGIRLMAYDSQSTCVTLGVSPTGECPGGRPTQDTIVVGDVGPRESKLVPITLRAAERVRVGDDTLLVTATGLVSGTTVRAAATASTTIAVTVLGLEAINGVGVSVLLLLPALLAFGIFLTLGRYLYPRRVKLPDMPDYKDPTALAWLAPACVITYLVLGLWVGKNLISTTSRYDLLALLVIGFGMGLLAWGMLAVIYFFRAERRIFKRGDSPTKVLRRLHWRKGALTLRVAKAAGTDKLTLGVVPDGVALVPQITFRHPDSAADDLRRKWRKAVTDQDSGTLAKLAKEGVAELRWTDSSGLNVYAVDAVTESASGETQLLLAEAI